MEDIPPLFTTTCTQNKPLAKALKKLTTCQLLFNIRVMLKGNTNWNLYKTFIAVYEIRNMHKAANTLGITRAAVSRNMKELGKQLGIVLFTSHSQGVEPTNEATNIYPIIKEAIELFTKAETLASKSNNENKTVVKIAIANTDTRLLLERYVKEFYVEYPDIKLKISNFEGMDLAKQKQQDVIIAAHYYIDPSFKTLSLYNTKSGFFVTKKFMKKHGITDTISKEQLFKLPIIARENGVWADFFAKQAGLEKVPLNLIPTVSPYMVYSMAKNSVGAGFTGEKLLKLMAGSEDYGLILLNITDMTFPTMRYVFAYHETLSKPARIFVDGFLNFCQQYTFLKCPAKHAEI